MVSHILEAIVKRRPGGMEVTSTGDFISKINDINSQEIEIENIYLKQIMTIWTEKRRRRRRGMRTLTEMDLDLVIKREWARIRAAR